MWGGVSLWFWFVFPWWWVVLSIFSCVGWPPGCLLWRTVYSCLLPISSLDYLFLGVEFDKFFVDFRYSPFISHVICKYLLPFCSCLLILLICFVCCAEAFYLFLIFKKFFNIYLLLRDRERQSMSRGGAEREGETESEAGFRLWAVSTEPDTEFQPTNYESQKSDA